MSTGSTTNSNKNSTNKNITGKSSGKALKKKSFFSDNRYKRAENFFSAEELDEAELADTGKTSYEKAGFSSKSFSDSKIKNFFTKKKIIVFSIILAVIIAILVIFLVPGIRNNLLKSALKSDFGASIADGVIGDGYENNVLDKDFDISKVAINEGVKTPEGYKVIALFGVDARDEELRTGSRTDSIMLICINEKTGEIKMGSIYRDTYLVDSINENGEFYIGKANAAYAIGGPEHALSMINRNFDLAVTDYGVVNFGGLANIIDAMGGVTLKISEEEKEEINYRMYEQIGSFGGEYVAVEKSGEVKLNGAQATAFCRIRAVSFKSPMDGQTYEIDYGRTARQRYTLTELFRQAKQAGINSFIDMINEICDNNVNDQKFIMTSLPVADFVKIMGTCLDMNIAGQEAFPRNDMAYITMLDSGSSIVAHTLEKNVILLHEFLFGEKNYQVSKDFHKYDDMITRMINLQKTGNADVMFDPSSEESETWNIGDYLIEDKDEEFTFQYITDDYYVTPEPAAPAQPDEVYINPTQNNEPVQQNQTTEAAQPQTQAPVQTEAQTQAQPQTEAQTQAQPQTGAVEPVTEAPVVTQATEPLTEPVTAAPQPVTEAPPEEGADGEIIE